MGSAHSDARKRGYRFGLRPMVAAIGRALNLDGRACAGILRWIVRQLTEDVVDPSGPSIYHDLIRECLTARRRGIDAPRLRPCRSSIGGTREPCLPAVERVIQAIPHQVCCAVTPGI